MKPALNIQTVSSFGVFGWDDALGIVLDIALSAAMGGAQEWRKPYQRPAEQYGEVPQRDDVLPNAFSETKWPIAALAAGTVLLAAWAWDRK